MLRYPYKLCSFYLPQTPTPEQEGPSTSNLTFLESVGSKELAYYITQYDYELFNAVNIVSISSFVWQVEIAELLAFKHCGLTPISVTISLNFLIVRTSLNLFAAWIYIPHLWQREPQTDHSKSWFASQKIQWGEKCLYAFRTVLWVYFFTWLYSDWLEGKIRPECHYFIFSSFRSSFGSKHRFSSLNISTSGFICWKSSSSWPHSKWFLKEIFNWMSKVIWDCVDFSFNSPCDWSRKLAFPPNQSDARLKSTATWSPEFSRASGRSF